MLYLEYVNKNGNRGDVMLDKHAVKLYTPKEIENAKTKGQVVGFVQGAAVMFVGLFLLKLIGWIPALLILIIFGFLGYGFIKKGRNEE